MLSQSDDRPALQLNDLLQNAGVDPAEVIVLRHPALKPTLQRIMLEIATDRPQLLTTHQGVQSGKLAQALPKARYIAAFLGLQPGAATFAGLYAIGEARPLPAAEFWALPAMDELMALGLKGMDPETPDQVFIENERTEVWADQIGQLTISWSGPELSWWRRAENNNFPVRTATEASAVASTPPLSPQPNKADDTMDDLFLAPSEVERILALWRTKKNLILQGAPGVGKSFIARRLAFALIGERDEGRVDAVQFHLSYGYEDFIQGYRPTAAGGFQLRDGVFHRFCRQAHERPDQDFVFIIDEISHIIGGMEALNAEIAGDKVNLGPGFCVGHSFFTPGDDFQYDVGWISRVVETEIRPLLEEYWFDEPHKAAKWADRLLAPA
jgi:hypothetical protein